MDPTHCPITLAEAFPALAPAVDAALHPAPLLALRRLAAWDGVLQRLALGACRRREHTLAELVQFPLAWYDRELDGAGSPPPGCRAVGVRALRAMTQARLLHWGAVVERTPPQLLEGTGAGLLIVCDVAAAAIDLAASWMTEPLSGHHTSVFGVASAGRNFRPRAVRS